MKIGMNFIDVPVELHNKKYKYIGNVRHTKM